MNKQAMKQEQLLGAFLHEARAGERPEVWGADTINIRSFMTRMSFPARPGVVVADGSFYQGGMRHGALLDMGVRGMIGKMCSGFGVDVKFMEHARAMIEHNALLGGYVWTDPTSTVARQVELIARQVDLCGGHLNSIWVDVEQAWASWPRYWDYIYRRIGWSEVPKLAPNRIYDYTAALLDAIRARYPEMMIGIYTGVWFIAGYAPRLAELTKRWLLWLAQYDPRWAGPLSAERVGEMENSLQTAAPGLPAGNDAWAMWQFTSSAKFDGSNLDLNFLPNDVYELMTGQAAEESVPPEEPAKWMVRTNARIGLNVRMGPGMQYGVINLLPFGSVVEIKREYAGWLETIAGGWIYKGYTEEVE